MTVANCIQDVEDNRPLLPENCYVLLGKNDLSIEEAGSVNSSILQFVSHPDWNPSMHRTNADIGIAVLTKLVDYSEFIAPICLYSKSSDKLFSETGTISGWGSTEINPRQHTDIALESDARIENSSSCVLENPELASFIGETCLCVVNGNETGACAGNTLRIENSYVLKILI